MSDRDEDRTEGSCHPKVHFNSHLEMLQRDLLHHVELNLADNAWIKLKDIFIWESLRSFYKTKSIFFFFISFWYIQRSPSGESGR